MIGGWRAGFRSPKTILGFFAALVAILGVTVYGLVNALGAIPAYQWAIPYVLGFGGGAFLLVAIAILFTAWIAPEKIMLGEITGTAYASIMKLKQGDSQQGEMTVVVSAPKQRGSKQAQPQLGSGETEGETADE